MISWDHSKQAIDSKMNRLTSRIEAVGLSPSAIMDELELQEQSTDREERVNFLELGRRQKELAATERRDGFAELGGFATTTNTDTCITTAINTSTSSPAVSALLEEKRYIRERMKECHKLALDVLRFYDRRQTAADDNISRLQQAFVMCNVSLSQDSIIKGLVWYESKQISHQRPHILWHRNINYPPALLRTGFHYAVRCIAVNPHNTCCSFVVE